MKTFLVEHFRLTTKLHELRSRTLLTFLAERFFLSLQLLSPPTWLAATRARAHILPGVERWRGHLIDAYMILWAAVLAVAVILARPTSSPHVHYWLSVLAILRLTDIFQSAVNIALFDHLRIEGKHTVASPTRSVLLFAWNYCELIVGFGILYALNLGWIHNAHSSADAYYFSAIAPLTVGFGDLAPLGFGRVLSVLQALAGFAIVALILARFVAQLPPIGSGPSSSERASPN